MESWMILSHLTAAVVGAAAGYTISIRVNSKKVTQRGNVVGGNMSGRDMNINDRDK